jgi:NAD(P)-dependent dehydrogenase (short-subunit alcohol dehydrogenase family)
VTAKAKGRTGGVAARPVASSPMRTHLAVQPHHERAFLDLGVEPADPGAASVLAAPLGTGDWHEALDRLTALYRSCRTAAEHGSPVVFLVSSDALLGRTGPLDAMAAMGVVSAARTLALELRKQQIPVNCVGFTEDTPADEVATWALRLLQSGAAGPTGELLQLGGVQIGKALS